MDGKYATAIGFVFLSRCLEWFFGGTVSVLLLPCKLLKQSAMIIGLYSGIFLIYFQYNASPKNASKRNNILFYALCSLYVLSMASIALDLFIYFRVSAVSKNEHLV